MKKIFLAGLLMLSAGCSTIKQHPVEYSTTQQQGTGATPERPYYLEMQAGQFIKVPTNE